MKNYEFKNGDVLFDVAEGTLTDAGGRPVELRPQSREVLQVLAAAPGRVVGKADFAREVWEGRQVGADSLVQCIAEIRAALGDTERRIVQTVPRRGYRLMLPETDGGDGSQRRRPALIAGALAAVLASVAMAWFAGVPRPAPHMPVVAVLPLEDLSPADHRGTLSDALSEGVITELARFPQFRTIARTSSFQFRDRPRDIRDIGTALGADYVVEGSQQFDGTRLRVTVQLIEAGDGLHVYSDQFDREIGDLFDIQDAVVRHVASVVGQSVIDDLPVRHGAGDVDARLRGLQARRIMTQFTHENWQKALALEETSIREEPESPWGYIGVSLMLVNGAGQGWRTPFDATLEEAADLARMALRLAPGNYMSHYALARVRSAQEDYQTALLHYRRAAELNPSDSLVLIAMSEPLLYAGRTEEAIETLLAAAEVDPLHGDWLRWQLGWAYWQDGQCDKGLEAMLSMSAPPIASRKSLAALYVCLDRIAEARAAMDEFLAARPGHSLADERRYAPPSWKPEGIADRWLEQMGAAGMPPG